MPLVISWKIDLWETLGEELEWQSFVVEITGRTRFFDTFVKVVLIEPLVEPLVEPLLDMILIEHRWGVLHVFLKAVSMEGVEEQGSWQWPKEMVLFWLAWIIYDTNIHTLEEFTCYDWPPWKPYKTAIFHWMKLKICEGSISCHTTTWYKYHEPSNIKDRMNHYKASKTVRIVTILI